MIRIQIKPMTGNAVLRLTTVWLATGQLTTGRRRRLLESLKQVRDDGETAAALLAGGRLFSSIRSGARSRVIIRMATWQTGC